MVIPSSCGMFVYRLVTSIETRIAFSTTLVFSMKLIKSVVSLRYDFCDLAIDNLGMHKKGTQVHRPIDHLA